LPDVGSRCGALRVRDAEHNWRIMYRIDSDAVLVLDVYIQEDPEDSRRGHPAVPAASETVRRGSESGTEAYREVRSD
jgi:hypothetical protein